MHQSTVQCKKAALQERCLLSAEDEREVTSRAFRAYGSPLDMMTSFKYLGQVISAADYDWPAVVGNLAKAREVWRSLTQILGREGAAPRVSGFLFKSVFQSVLTFGA